MACRHILDEFIGDYKLDRKEGVSIVTTEDLSRLKSAGHTVEDLLDHLSTHYQSLFHGSRTDIPDGHLNPNEEGIVYGSNLAGIALMRAVISNKNLKSPGLRYPYLIDKEHPLEVKIYGINEDTVGNNGFVYVVNQTEGFENYPKNSWQYVKKNIKVPISAKIGVQRTDFKYPVFDVTNNVMLQ